MESLYMFDPAVLMRRRRLESVKPSFDKVSRSVYNPETGIKAGLSCMQGWRPTMEDKHVGFLRLPGDLEATFFGVYDGHGGSVIAQLASERLHGKLVSDENYKKGKIADALRGVMIELDKELLADPILKNTLVGCTAIVVLIKDNQIFCANLGDSRAIASVSGHAIPLSFDHKPDKGTERTRILESGGWISHNGRANGIITTSRTFGDFPLKASPYLRHEYQILSCYPDVSIKEIIPELEFIIMACDGIWDVKSSQEAVDYVRPRLAQGLDPGVVAEQLMDNCVAKNIFSPKGFDNMTVAIICLLQGRTKEQYTNSLSAPRSLTFDPHLTLLTLETGPPDNDKLPIAINPKRQRRWGIAERQADFEDVFVPTSLGNKFELPSTSRSRRRTSTVSDQIAITNDLTEGSSRSRRRNTDGMPADAGKAGPSTAGRLARFKQPNPLSKLFGKKTDK